MLCKDNYFEIFGFCDSRTLVALKYCCKQFHELANLERYWSRLFFRDTLLVFESYGGTISNVSFQDLDEKFGEKNFQKKYNHVQMLLLEKKREEKLKQKITKISSLIPYDHSCCEGMVERLFETPCDGISSLCGATEEMMCFLVGYDQTEGCRKFVEEILPRCLAGERKEANKRLKEMCQENCNDAFRTQCCYDDCYSCTRCDAQTDCECCFMSCPRNWCVDCNDIWNNIKTNVSDNLSPVQIYDDTVEMAGYCCSIVEQNICGCSEHCSDSKQEQEERICYLYYVLSFTACSIISFLSILTFVIFILIGIFTPNNQNYSFSTIWMIIPGTIMLLSTFCCLCSFLLCNNYVKDETDCQFGTCFIGNISYSLLICLIIPILITITILSFIFQNYYLTTMFWCLFSILITVCSLLTSFFYCDNESSGAMMFSGSSFFQIISTCNCCLNIIILIGLTVIFNVFFDVKVNFYWIIISGIGTLVQILGCVWFYFLRMTYIFTRY